MSETQLWIQGGLYFAFFAGMFVVAAYISIQARVREIEAYTQSLEPLFDPGSLRSQRTPFLTFSRSGVTVTGTRGGRCWAAHFSQEPDPASYRDRELGRRRRWRPLLYSLDLTVEAAGAPKTYHYTQPVAYGLPEVESLIRHIESGMIAS